MNADIFGSQLWMDFWIPIPWNNRREIDAIWNLGDCGEGGVCTGMVSSVIVRLSFGSRGGIAVLAPGPSQRPICGVPMVHCSEVRRTPSYLLWCAFLQGAIAPTASSTARTTAARAFFNRASTYLDSLRIG